MQHMFLCNGITLICIFLNAPNMTDSLPDLKTSTSATSPLKQLSLVNLPSCAVSDVNHSVDM